jgi:hypothetical protein
MKIMPFHDTRDPREVHVGSTDGVAAGDLVRHVGTGEIVKVLRVEPPYRLICYPRG